MTIDLKCGEDEAALVMSPDGSMRMYLPTMQDEDLVPEHMAKIAALAIVAKTPALMDYVINTVYEDFNS